MARARNSEGTPEPEIRSSEDLERERGPREEAVEPSRGPSTTGPARELSEEEIEDLALNRAALDEEKRRRGRDKDKGSDDNIPVDEARSPQAFRGRVVIEIGDDRNRNIMWNPTQDVLRGRWDKDKLRAGELNQKTEMIPTIPGLRIEIDGRRRVLRIYDPLDSERLASLLAKVKRGVKAAINVDGTPEKERRYEDSSETEIKTWLWWARRLVEGVPLSEDELTATVRGGPQARVIEGSLPSLAQIERLPGKVQMEHHNSSSKKRRHREDPELVAND